MIVYTNSLYNISVQCDYTSCVKGNLHRHIDGMAIKPLSKILKKKEIGYNLGNARGEKSTQEKINPLFFMDDLKLYADNNEHLNELVKTVHHFSKDICMEFGLEKCSKCTVRNGKKANAQNLHLEDGGQIEDLETDTIYKYLGIEENRRIHSFFCFF